MDNYMFIASLLTLIQKRTKEGAVSWDKTSLTTFSLDINKEKDTNRKYGISLHSQIVEGNEVFVLDVISYTNRRGEWSAADKLTHMITKTRIPRLYDLCLDLYQYLNVKHVNRSFVEKDIEGGGWLTDLCNTLALDFNEKLYTSISNNLKKDTNG